MHIYRPNRDVPGIKRPPPRFDNGGTKGGEMRSRGGQRLWAYAVMPLRAIITSGAETVHICLPQEPKRKKRKRDKKSDECTMNQSPQSTMNQDTKIEEYGSWKPHNNDVVVHWESHISKLSHCSKAMRQFYLRGKKLRYFVYSDSYLRVRISLIRDINTRSN